MNKTSLSRWTSGFALAAGMATSVIAPSEARGDAGDAAALAQQHFAQARRMFDGGEIDEACAMFAQSYSEDVEPGTLYNLSVCRERQGRLADAYRGLLELGDLAERAGKADRAAAARKHAMDLTGKLARLDLVRAEGATVTITGLSVDDVVLAADAWKKPVYVMPGVHHVLVKHGDGIPSDRTTMNLVAGAAERLVVDEAGPTDMAAPAPVGRTPIGRMSDASEHGNSAESAHPGDRLQTAGLIVGGAGVVFLVGGVVLGVLTKAAKDDATNACGATGGTAVCASPAAEAKANDSVDRARTYRTLSTVGYAGGGASLVAGVVLLWRSRSEAGPPKKAALIDKISPTFDRESAGITVGGAF